MKIQNAFLLSFLAMNLAIANDFDQKQFEQEKQQVLLEQEKNQPEMIDLRASVADDQKDIDAIEASAVKFAKEAKRKELEAKKLGHKSEKLAKKSVRLEDKSRQFDEKSEKSENLSKVYESESKRYADQVENFEFKAQREEALREICGKKIQKAKIFKIFDRRSEEQQIEKCIAEYKESKLEKKNKIKRAYLGKQCIFNPGVSIECPEGTYKFEGSNGIASVNSGDRQEQKDMVGEKSQIAEADDSEAVKK